MTDKPHNLQAINMTETGKQGGGDAPSIPSAVRPTVPIELLPARVLQWSMDSGYLTMTYPAQITLEEIEEVERVLEITVRVMKRTASAAEAELAAAAHPSPESPND